MRTLLASILLVIGMNLGFAQNSGGHSKPSTPRGTLQRNTQVAEELRNIREMLSAQQKQLAIQAEEIQRLRAQIADRDKQVADTFAQEETSQAELKNTLASQKSETVKAVELNVATHNEDIKNLQLQIRTTAATATEASKTSGSAIQSGFGAIKFNGLLQVWGVAGSGGYHDSFRVRRTEMKFTGNVTPNVRWTLMIDPSKALSVNSVTSSIGGSTVVSSVGINQAGRILQDAFITVEKIPNIRIDAGQLKIPLSLESTESSAALATTERALFMSDRARGGSLGDIRDVGVMLTSRVGRRVTLYLGEFNSVGDRQNDVAVNDQKATVARITFKPTGWLHFGASGAYGNGGTRPDRPRRDRLGAEFMISHRGFNLKSEWMEGKDGNVLRQGYYAVASYRLKGKLSPFEPVLRFDTFDPDVSHSAMNAATTPEKDYIAGINWYLPDTHFKVQANYTRKTFQRDVTPTRDMLFLNLQTSW